MSRDPEYWAVKLEMLPHPEGGWYKETYRSSEVVNAKGFEEDKYKYEFSIDINDGKGMENPEAAAYIFFDPAAEGFGYADERPMSASAGN